ncbi:MAG: hypothetical protein LBE22_04380 [Azoarcus sp.]|jgi:hypothetical protein|nr:hypothetical protein [Azoarcus sp.]
MDKTGLIWKFKVDRELSAFEIDNHLPVDKAYNGLPDSMMSTIRMNSTYLECCDKFYFGKGEITGHGLIGFIAYIFVLSLPLLDIIFEWPARPGTDFDLWLWSSIFIYSIAIPAMLFTWFTWLGKELFRYTHYPIRFNRKTRMVHVFRLDGTVMSEPWDKLYFTVGAGKEFETIREVRFHRMSSWHSQSYYGKVLETHALPYVAAADKARAQWEFVRRYMEKGPAEALPLIDLVLDGHIGLPGKRESFMHGYRMLSTNMSGIIFYLFFPLTSLSVIGRWIAMRTCKQPVWPAEIEAECAIEPDDPYLVDANHLPPRVIEADKQRDYRKCT